MGTHEYTWESSRVSSLIAPKPSSYHKCYKFEDKLIAVLGMTDDLGNPKDVNMWNFKTKQWTVVVAGISSRSRTVADQIGNDIVYIGGASWNSYVVSDVNVIKLSERSHKKIDSMTFNSYAAAGAYHKNSFYIFGGGGSDLEDGALIHNHASDVLVKYTLGEDFPCSKGSFRENGECVVCPRGTYKDTTGDYECTLCPPGHENPKAGADHYEFCILCARGFYSSNWGSPYCFECPYFLD